MSDYDLTIEANARDLAMRYVMKGQTITALLRTLIQAGASEAVQIAASESYFFAIDNLEEP